jgi:hypothetical protein
MSDICECFRPITVKVSTFAEWSGVRSPHLQKNIFVFFSGKIKKMCNIFPKKIVISRQCLTVQLVIYKPLAHNDIRDQIPKTPPNTEGYQKTSH